MTELLTFSTFEICLIGITFLLFVIQMMYNLITYARPLRFAKKRSKSETQAESRTLPPVSIIIYARGDAESLRSNLPLFLSQDYPDYEVIVVNDGEDSDSEDVLKILSSENKHLYYTYVPVDTQYLSHKKLALTMGIKAAKNDILLFTEANCQPLSQKWIQTMTASYASGTDIRLGFCAFQKNKGFLNKLISYDNLLNGLQYLSSALAHHPFSGNGKNLSYRRNLFFAHKGYSKSLNIHAGADDLFINEAATKQNTQVEFSPESIISIDNSDYLTWKEMKIARVVTQHFFKGASLAFHKFYTASFFLFLIAALATIVFGIFGNWTISIAAGLLLIARFIIKAMVFRRSSLLLQQKPLCMSLLILEFALPLYNMYIHIYRKFRGKIDYTSRI